MGETQNEPKKSPILCTLGSTVTKFSKKNTFLQQWGYADSKNMQLEKDKIKKGSIRKKNIFPKAEFFEIETVSQEKSKNHQKRLKKVLKNIVVFLPLHLRSPSRSGSSRTRVSLPSWGIILEYQKFLWRTSVGVNTPCSGVPTRPAQPQQGGGRSSVAL